MKKKVFSLLFSLVILAGALFGPLSPGLTAAAFQPTDFEVSAEGAMLVSLDTGGVLYAKNIDARLYPASLTKIMTAVIVIENTSDLDTEIITVSKEALQLLQGTDSSTTGLKEGEELTARHPILRDMPLMLSSDAHYLEQLQPPKAWIEAEANTPAAILSALSAGCPWSRG